MSDGHLKLPPDRYHVAIAGLNGELGHHEGMTSRTLYGKKSTSLGIIGIVYMLSP
jgi:hypothetical protein